MAVMYRVQAEFHSSQSEDDLTDLLREALKPHVTYPSAIQIVVFQA